MSIAFDLQLPPHAVFNFIFNFKNAGDFKMLRLDTRDERGAVNDLLYCTQKYFWRSVLHASDPDPPAKAILPIKVKIDFPAKMFLFEVDGKAYQYTDSKGSVQDLFGELESGLKIGFFNEVRPVRLLNIEIHHS
jgi:hypothetical protein